MNWKEFCERREPILKREMAIKKELADLERAYIKEHEKFHKGDRVVVKAKRSVRHAVVYGNKIGNEGRIIPVLLLIRKNRTSRPNFYHQHEFDESILIEKYNEDNGD